MSLIAKKPIKLLRENTILGPAAILFVSANIANAANLIFNMIFARLMGPALFADLTLLLTLKLGVLSFLGALQFAFAERVAKERYKSVGKIKARVFSLQSLKLSVPLMFIVIVSSEALSSILNFSSPISLSLLALAIPFFLPMVIYRGLTQGRIEVPKIVLSIQAEWILRLFGSLVLWKMGLGLPGIAIAVGLSIVAAFLFSTDKSDFKLQQLAELGSSAQEAKVLGGLALPYLILQTAQVLILDSDIIIAKAFFSPEAAGLVAGLLLIQRVFFFAFLSCSTILQPYVAQHGNSRSTLRELFLLLAGIATISIAALVIIIPSSQWVVKIMLGTDYAELSPIVWVSALTGAVFIISHLCAIYQIARGRKLAAFMVLTFGIAQLISLSVVNHLFPDLSLHSYFSIKLAIQTLCAVSLLGTVLATSRRALNT